jgi:CcmD family protein
MAFMVAAYLIIWLAAFIFILSIVRRQSTLQREISSLRELVREHDARDL